MVDVCERVHGQCREREKERKNERERERTRERARARTFSDIGGNFFGRVIEDAFDLTVEEEKVPWTRTYAWMHLCV